MRHLHTISGILTGTMKIPDLLDGRLKVRHLRLLVAIDEHFSEEGLRAGLLAGELDLGIDRIRDDADDEPLHRQTLYIEPLRVICSAEHPARRLREPTLADVLHYPWSLPVAQTGLRAG